jgi:hypothetical protein
MSMINMKMSREEAKEYNTIEANHDAPEYPYGLRIDLNDDSLEKLGITALPKVGTEMTMTCKVTVTSVSAYDRQGGEAEQSVCLQITDMELGAGKTQSDAATSLYGS